MTTLEQHILLLTKRLSGDLTAEEAQQLQHWLDASSDNRQLSEEVAAVWQKTGAYEPAFETDLEADFGQLLGRIRQEERPRAKVMPMRQVFLRAAALALLLAAGWWMYRSIGTESPQEIIVQATMPTQEVVLPDGSHVWLRQGSTLHYPAAFNGSERKIQLEGEAFFDVSHNANQPFKIALPEGAGVQVLGTSFDIRAFAGESETKVLVRSGRVQFRPNASAEGVILTAGQKGLLQRKAARLVQSNVSTFNELSWQTGGLEFIDTPLRDVIRDLEATYHVKISLSNPVLGDCRHTAPLTNQPIEQVLESIALTHQLQLIAQKPGEFLLKGSFAGKANHKYY